MDRATWIVGLLAALGACGLDLPEGRFPCVDENECPSGWSCRIDGYCYRTGDDGVDASPSVDGGVVDVARDAGANDGTVDGPSVDGPSDDVVHTRDVALTIAPADFSFGIVAVGATSALAELTVRNEGRDTSGPLALDVDAADFEITSHDCDALAATESCRVHVRFAPRAEGEHSGTLRVRAAADSAEAVATLTGAGADPDGLFLEPGFHDFGTIVLGAAVAPATFTLTNHGHVASGELRISLDSEGATPLALAHECGSLAPGASCALTVRPQPSTAGSIAATLHVSATPGGSLDAPLVGAAVTPAAIEVTAASTAGFGEVLLGSSAERTFLVTNVGGQETGALQLEVGGDFAALTGAPGDCVGGTTRLSHGATCNVRVRFSPRAAGPRSATLTIDASPGGRASAALAGTGLTPGVISPSTTSHSFGDVEVGRTSGSFRWTITNTGDTTTGVPSLTSSAPEELEVTSGCTSALAPGASCTVELTFTPRQGGARAGTVSLSASPGGQVALSVGASGAWRLDVSRSGDGTVTSLMGPLIRCGSECATLVPHGARVTLRATTENGRGTHFRAWSGECEGSFRDCTLTMTSHRRVGASFAATTDNLVFVSSQAFPANVGGAAGFDDRCNALATAAGINDAAGNAFRAWVSSPRSTLASRWTAAGGVRRLDGALVAESREALLRRRAILSPIRVTELGQELSGEVLVWSSTTDTGEARGNPALGHCSDWTSTGGPGNVDRGSTAGGPGIFTVATAGGSCASTHRIFCVQSTIATPAARPVVPRGGKIAFSAPGWTPSGGLHGADAFCNANKPEGFASRSFRALLATTRTTAASRLDATARYFRPDGTFVGTGAQLASGELASGIWQSASGTYDGGEQRVFTGATSPTALGTAETTCRDWAPTTRTDTARRGSPNRLTTWFSADVGSCAESDRARTRLYCVEE
ncbi:MAG: choice-of-anchor D domain-containing protein [Myxococcales bacterium]|nr:choice-of-anchor D domain-containing protein [Myxococcales bacterium]